MADKRKEMLAYLGVGHPAPPRGVGTPDVAHEKVGVSEAAPAEVAAPELTVELVRQVRKDLDEQPEAVLEHAPSIFGPKPSKREFARVLDRAEQALADPAAALEQMRTTRIGKPWEKPADDFVPDPAIPIRPYVTQFETVADAPAWAVTAVQAWVWRKFRDKPPLPLHTDHAGGFDYELRDGTDGYPTLGLFSDWGTGYYHSQYIAKHVVARKPGQAAHLGDVYYTGSAAEFAGYVQPYVDGLIANGPFYMINANHEMDSLGIPYFDFLRWKHAQPEQPQESSYFCLEGERYQVLGLDTAYDKAGRHRMPALVAWLEERLRRGREQGKFNVLLSQNAPYHNRAWYVPRFLNGWIKSGWEDLWEDDLERYADLIDVWFWGDHHYAAVFPPTKRTPFLGCCIGHGGYPFTHKEPEFLKRPPFKPLWVEKDPRHPKAWGVKGRRCVGNNGYAWVDLEPDRVRVTYRDWRDRRRCVIDYDPKTKGYEVEKG